MRRFFLQSILLHGIVLMLLVSWENPLTGKIGPRNIIQVSLIEKGGDETPSTNPEGAAEKPKGEKRIVRRTPPPPLVPKETSREIREKDPKEDPPQKEPAPQNAPDFQALRSEPLPGPPASGPAQPPGSPAGKTGGRPEKEQNPPGLPGSGGAVLMTSLIHGPGREENAVSGAGGNEAKISGSEGGNSERNPAASLSAVDPVLAQIMSRIEEAKRYPRAARRMRIEGKTVVRFKLKPGGQVEAAEVAESSGSDILDEASLKTVREAAPLPYKAGWLKVGIVFKIL
jgi:TonB family protein